MANLWQKAPSGSIFPLDFGISERLGIGKANPNVVNSGTALYQPQAATTTNTANLPSFSGTGQINNNPAVVAKRGAVLGTNNNRTAAPPPTSNPGQANQGPSQEDLINQAFGSTESFLNDMMREYESQLPDAQKNIESSFERGLTPIAEREATEIGSLDTQEGVVNREEANALSQARQLYNELQQRNISIYGSGSSAGPASSEILGRATARQFGSIGDTATSGRTTIEGERGNVKKFAAQKREDLKLQKEEAIRELQTEFRSNIMKINGMKAQNETAKAQARLEMLQQAQQQAFEIEQADKAYARAIDQFEREKASNLSQVGAYRAQSNIDTDTVNAISAIMNSGDSNAVKAARLYSVPGIDQKMIGSILGQVEKKNQFGVPSSIPSISGLTPVQE